MEPPQDLPEDPTAKMARLTEAVMSGLYNEARQHYIDMLLGNWFYGALREQLLSDIRPVEEIDFSETALDTLLNDGTFVLVTFEAPHPFEEGMKQFNLIFHRDNIAKVDVLQNPEQYIAQWEEFQRERRIPYVAAETNPSMSSPNYPWNRSNHAEEQISNR